MFESTSRCCPLGPLHFVMEYSHCTMCVPPRYSSTITSKVIRKIPDHFMESLACKSTLDSLQDALLNHSTAELGVVYDKFCSIIFDELTVKKIRPRGKCIKPWWTPELSLLRKNGGLFKTGKLVNKTSHSKHSILRPRRHSIRQLDGPNNNSSVNSNIL